MQALINNYVLNGKKFLTEKKSQCLELWDFNEIYVSDLKYLSIFSFLNNLISTTYNSCVEGEGVTSDYRI